MIHSYVDANQERMTVAMAVTSQESKRAVDLFSSHAALSSIHDFTGWSRYAGERLGGQAQYYRIQ